MIGEMVGSYRITRPLGEGGMGVVYLAEHPLLGRQAIVKMLRPELSRHRENIERFFNEARASTLIQHPGIVDIFDFGYHASGHAFIVMELLHGESLAGRLKTRGVLSEPEAYAIVRGIAGALAAAHAVGIVHRDLKPENIYLVPDPDIPGGERVKLLDFGIAKLTVETTARSGSTRTGALLGTPLYMAPEQCRGSGDIDHRADLYAVGCILFEMLSGRLPFESDGSGEIIGAHQFVPPPPLHARAPGCSPAAENLVARLLAKPRDERVQTAQELLHLTAVPPSRTAGDPVPIPPTIRIHSALSTPSAPSALSAPGTIAPAFAGTAVLTTLGGVAGTHPATVARRRGWFVGAAAVAIVLAVAGLMTWRMTARDPDAAPDQPATVAASAPGSPPAHQDGTRPRSPEAAAPAPNVEPAPAIAPTAGAASVPSATAAPAPQAAAAPAPQAAAAAAPGPDPATPTPAVDSAPPLPATVPLHVTTVPAGADVAIDGKPLGSSPIDATVARSTAPLRVVITRKGYETRVVTVPRSGPINLEMQLSPRAKAKRPEASLDKNRTVNPFDD